MATRSEQREETRRHLVETAVELLVTRGLAATTTVEVQRRAGLSRGALLHHFPTRQALLGATIRTLMERNEAAVHEAAAEVPAGVDPVERAIRVLRSTVVRPPFAAELELWAAARTDAALRTVLRREERSARRELDRVVDEIFGPELMAAPGYRTAVALTEQFMRGLAISHVLRGERRATDGLVRDWAAVVRLVLADRPIPSDERTP